MHIVHKNAEPFFFMGGETGCLLVHGFTGSPSEMRHLGNFLAQQGYTVLGVRLAGHGTNPEEMATTSWFDWYRSVERAYVELSEQCSQVFIIGLSMGGILSLHASLEYPAKGIVAINSPIYLGNQAAIFAPVLRLIASFSDKKGYPEFPDHFCYNKLPLGCVNSLLQLIRMVKKELPRVSAPLLVLQSRLDETVNPKSAEYIFARSGSSEKHLDWFEKSGHLVTLGTEREAVFKRILEFIKSLE